MSSLRRVVPLAIGFVVLTAACSRKPAPISGPDAGEPDASAPGCERMARYVGSRSCRLGGGSEDGSSCDDFEVGRFGPRTIVSPQPDELGGASGSAVMDGDGPLHLERELAAGYPKELRELTASLYFRTSYAGIWPDRFFLVWRSLEDKPRVKAALWQGDHWGAPIFDRSVPREVFPQARTDEAGEPLLVLGDQAFALSKSGVKAVVRQDAGTVKRAARTGCIALPKLASELAAGHGFHEAPGGFELVADEDDGMWIHAHRDVVTDAGGPSRTYFLFRAPP